MPKKNRIAIYSYLFKEGCIVVQKDVAAAKHHILDVPNLHAMDAMKSLKSKGHVKEVFSWQWHYYFLLDSGVEYLRQYLHLDANVVPDTLKKPAKPIAVLNERKPFGRGAGDKEKGVAPGGGSFQPRFEGGYRREGGFARGPRAETAAAPAATTSA